VTTRREIKLELYLARLVNVIDDLTEAPKNNIPLGVAARLAKLTQIREEYRRDRDVGPPQQGEPV
jgi:hypothetical protein